MSNDNQKFLYVWLLWRAGETIAPTSHNCMGAIAIAIVTRLLPKIAIAMRKRLIATALNIILSLSRGKAAGLDCITAEHLQNCHPIISTLLAKLFNLMMRYHYVPRGFGLSYTVPIPKVKDCRSKAMTCDDFRGIAMQFSV